MKDLKISIALIFLIIIALVFAVYLIPKPKQEFQKVDCFQSYHFTSDYFDNVRAEKTSYNSGENVTFFYIIKNPYDVPITDASLRVQILYNGNDVQREEGDDIVDEFFAVRNLNLLPGDSYSGEFAWKIPSKIKSGTYRANFFLVSSDKLYLSGASFVSYIPGDSVSFTVKSDEDQLIYFDRTNIFVNDEKYNFIGSPPTFSEEDTITIKTDLINGGKRKDVQMSYQVFEFDDMLPSEEIKSYSKTETISLDSNEKKTVSLSLKKLPINSYLVKFTAVSDEQKSVLKLKVPVSGNKGRFVYLTLNSFPIEAGENSVIFCLTNTGAEPGSTESFDGIVELQLLDKDGQIIFEKEENVEISGSVNGYSFDFNSPKLLSAGKLVASIYDSQKQLQDKMEINYNGVKFLGTKKNLDVLVVSTPRNEGENLVFRVDYKDENGNPVEGKIVSLVYDSSGKVVAAVKEKSIIGQSEEKVNWTPLLKGTYKLKVIDSVAKKDITKEFTIS